MPQQMQAAVVTQFGKPLALQEWDMPTPGAGQIVVKTEACGVCHTDLHAAGGDWPLKPALPFIPGHEGIGIVTAIGAGVTAVKEGDRVGVPWLYSACGHCEYCLSAWETVCAQAQFGGYTKNGGFAGYILADPNYVAHIPKGLGPSEAAPLICAGITSYKGIKEADVRPGQWIVISGVGGLGHLAVQQRLEMAVNAGKLGVLIWLAAHGASVLDASAACLVNLLVAAIYLLTMRRHSAVYAPRPQGPMHSHRQALLAHVFKQAPNSIYYLLSSQIGVWLIGIFGTAQRVAEVGALGRLAAVFALLSAVGVALVQPYFARHHARAELQSGLASVNLFFAFLLVALLTAGAAEPEAILWVLGGHYGSLQQELLWMLAAATLSAWGGMLYGVGCARGWVLPFWINAVTGVIVIALTAMSVDLGTVRGTLMLNTAVAGGGLLVVLGYLWWRLRRSDSLAPALQ